VLHPLFLVIIIIKRYVLFLLPRTFPAADPRRTVLIGYC